jgi:hypothetical protein
MSDFVASTKQTEKPNRLGYRALKLVQAYLEDGLAGYTTSKTERSLQGDIMGMLSEAGAEDVSITPGLSKARDAFRLRFTYEGLLREMVQVCLPQRTRTDRAKQQARKQALYNLHESIRMELERRHYQPDVPAFIGYVLTPGENRTLAEIISSNELPHLLLADVIDAEIMEGVEE